MPQCFWVVWFTCVALAQDDPYCSVRYERLCQGKGPHVACQYPFRGAGPACENYTAIIFTNDLKQFILHYVNRRRQKIASGHERVRGGVHLPKPEIMMLVQWDRELAYLAQRLADQCRFVHDDCRATVRYPYAGQTVGEVRWRRSSMTLAQGARRAIGRVFDAWWGERRRVHAKQLISPFALTARGAVWGHFSQLAVWTLRAMGCGAVHHGSARPRLLLVCDFSHTNMLGQRTISPGPLAPCPQHTMRLGRPYPLLCGATVNPLSTPGVAINQAYGRQPIIESGDDEDDEEMEEMDEDDEELDKEEEEVRQSPNTEGTEDAFYPTRPWPNRPLKLIQDASNKDIQQIRQQEPEMQTNHQPVKSQQRTIDTDYTVRPQHGTGDEDNLSASEQHAFENQPDTSRQEFRNVNIHNQPLRGQCDIDIQQERQQIIDADNQLSGPQYMGINTGQPIRQHHTLDNNRRLRPVQDVRPVKNMKPTKDMTPEVQDNDDNDYLNVRPLNDNIIDRNRATTEIKTDHPERIGDFMNTDRPSRPIKVSVIDSDIRPVIPLVDDKSQRGRRPVVPSEEDYEDEQTVKKKTTVTDGVVKVSVKYRDNPDSTFQQKFNDELSWRSRETKLKNSQYGNSDSERQNQQSDDKIRHRINSHRLADARRKGVYKAHNGDISMGSRKELDGFDPNRPFLFQRWGWGWGDDTPEFQDSRMDFPSKKSTYPPVKQMTTIVVYRPTSLFSSQTVQIYRQRWTQARVRPRRPGANALLQASNAPNFIKPKKTSLLLDKDEEEQLYQDTGFKLSTKH